MENLVSIITPSYNCAGFIAETIESVQNQTYQNWEMIVVDDCSTDDTRTIVESYQAHDSRIKYYYLALNSGAAVARTKAMELASGKYIAFLDSDDVWVPTKLEKQIAFMLAHQYNFTCTAYAHMDEQGKPLDRIIKTKRKTDYNGILLSCPVGNSTVIYNAENLGKFTVPNIKKRNDDALWLQILKKEKFIYGLNQVLTRYRIRQNSISINKIDLFKYHWQLYREIEHLSLPRSIFHICFWIFLKVFHVK
ncbi:glycosyltransferase family 2 protein [bacterium]|nr:glycosyltransferase family 2 protein [bacterium]